MDLKDKIENEIIYKPFTANVPIAQWPEQFPVIDAFCKEHFMDNRWSMIWTLVNDAISDYKYKMLFDKVTELEYKVTELSNKPVEEKKKVLKTFGSE